MIHQYRTAPACLAPISEKAREFIAGIGNCFG